MAVTVWPAAMAHDAYMHSRRSHLAARPAGSPILRRCGRAATVLAHLLCAALLVVMVAFGSPDSDAATPGNGLDDAASSVEFDAHSDGRP